jgi:dienelactone hydrolase
MASGGTAVRFADWPREFDAIASAHGTLIATKTNTADARPLKIWVKQ